MHAKRILWLAALLVATSTRAQTIPPSASTSPSAPTPDTAVNLQTVTVHGEQPGPALWEVRRGDHVMWIIGTMSPLPKNAEWQWTQLEKALGRSQELLEAPSARLKMPTSLFSRLALLPSAKLNPGGGTLERLLTPDMYARWRVLRKQYMQDDDALEYMRPIIVAERLYQDALTASALTDQTDLEGMIEKLAHKHGTRVIGVRYELVVTHAKPATTVDQDQKQGIACLDETMQTVERDLPALTQRANAWATGDMKTLQSLVQQTHYDPCVVAAINGDFEHQLNVPDLPKRIEDAWMDAMDHALVRNRSTVAILTMEQLMAPDGYIAKLKSRGFIIRPPAGVTQ